MTVIGHNAFQNNKSLYLVTIPDTVTSIERYAFEFCTNLQSITIPDSVTKIADYAFSGCTNLRSIDIPDSLTELGSYTFNGDTSLAEVTFSKSMTEIPRGAFSGCGFKTLTIPSQITKIGSDAFSNCVRMTNVDVSDSVKEIGDECFSGCTALTDVKLPKNTDRITYKMFTGDKAIVTLDIPDTVKAIGSYAFSECTSLAKIVIPDSVTALDSYAFYKDKKLTDVTLSKGLTEMSPHCFDNCTTLASIVIPKGVKQIGDYAFYQDVKLLTYTIPQTVTEIGSNAINYPTKLTVYGCAGSYAETWSTKNRVKQFIDITKPITRMTLPNDENFVRVNTWTKFTPEITCEPEDNTDVLSYTSANTNVVSVNDDGTLYARNEGTTTVTATATSGQTFNFKVVVGTIKSLVIKTPPTKTTYNIGDKPDTSGLVLSAVYNDNIVEEVTGGYTCAPDEFTESGSQTVTVTFDGKTVSFNVTVKNQPKPTSTPTPEPTSTPTPKPTSTPTPEPTSTPTPKPTSTPTPEPTSTPTPKPTSTPTPKPTSTPTPKPTSTPTPKPTSTPSPTFTDVTDTKSFLYKSVAWASGNNIVLGYSDGTFRPNDSCTRGQAFAFLWRLAGRPLPKTKTSPFKDVTSRNPFYKAILWGYENNLVKGYSDKTFRPDNTCTRSDIMLFLWRYAGKPTAEKEVSFKDIPRSSSYSTAICWGADAGITTGYSDKTFRPNNTCTRGQIVQFLYRYAHLK